LLKRVNEADAFDVAVNLTVNDRLQVSFRYTSTEEGYVHYGFVHKA
jgi:hypothetical protein